MDDRSIGLFGSLSVRLAGSQTPSTTPSRIAGIRNEVPYAKGTCNEREVKSIIERVRDGKKSIHGSPRYNIGRSNDTCEVSR